MSNRLLPRMRSFKRWLRRSCRNAKKRSRAWPHRDQVLTFIQDRRVCFVSKASARFPGERGQAPLPDLSFFLALFFLGLFFSCAWKSNKPQTRTSQEEGLAPARR